MLPVSCSFLCFLSPGCSALCSPHFPVGSKSWYYQSGLWRMKLRSRQCSNFWDFAVAVKAGVEGPPLSWGREVT